MFPILRRIPSLPVLFAAVLSSCIAAPAVAQDPREAQEPAVPALQPAPPEPAAAPGTVVLRIANATDCPMLLRMKQNGETIGVGVVKPRALSWGHVRAGGGVYEVELVVSPRLCGLVLSAPVQRDTETAPRAIAPVWRTSLARPPGPAGPRARPNY